MKDQGQIKSILDNLMGNLESKHKIKPDLDLVENVALEIRQEKFYNDVKLRLEDLSSLELTSLITLVRKKKGLEKAHATRARKKKKV